MSNISFKTSVSDRALIEAIANRASEELGPEIFGDDPLTQVAMSITACHANGCKLDLQRLLEADRFNFLHDVVGIDRHVSRQTGRLTGFFQPRFSAPDESPSLTLPAPAPFQCSHASKICICVLRTSAG